MTGDKNQHDDQPNEAKISEAQIAEILQRVGPRGKPSPEMATVVKANVKTVWREEVATAAKLRKRNNRFAIAASVAVLALVSFLLVPAPTTNDVATAGQVVGTVEYKGSDNSGWRSLQTGTRLPEAAELRTSQDSYAAVTLASGMHVRIDQATQFAITGPTQLLLNQGGLYAKSDDEAFVVINTPFGVARDIGTEFEVRVLPEQWRVQVREGRVDVSQDGQTMHIAEAGERFVMTPGKQTERVLVSASDDSWHWTHEVHQPFDLEGASLREYLNWWSDETGRQFSFVNASDMDAAETTILHGSLTNVAVLESLSVVLSTTRFEIVDSSDNQVILGR